MSDADGSVNDAVFHSFSAWSELAYGDVEIAFYSIFRRPLKTASRIGVIEKAGACWKAKHRKQPGVRETFAQCVLRVELIVRSYGSDFVDEAVAHPIQQTK